MMTSLVKNSLFAIIIFCSAFLLYVYPFMAIGHLLNDSPLITSRSLVASLVVSAIVFFYLRTHATNRLLSGFTHYGMGIGFISLGIVSIGLLLDMVAPDFSYPIALACIVIASFCCGIAIVNGRRLSVKSLHLTSDKIDKQVKLVFISDVHLGSNPKTHLVALCAKIDTLSYDGLLIGGDLFDSSAFETDHLAPLKTLKKPVFFVTGNHEFYVRDHSAKLARLADYNIQMIDNQSAMLGPIHIVGIGDKQSVEDQSQIAHQLVRDDTFNLILVHQPGIWGKLPASADFMISGHTHNGQIFPFNYLVRLQFKAVYGLYHHLNTTLYVSSGSGCWGPAMRLGTRNEIVHITIDKG